MENSLQKRFKELFPKEKYSFRYLDRIAHSGDASFFRQIPSLVFFPENEEDILKAIAVSGETNIPLTFRAAATSLSGQTMGSGIVVDISRHFREYSIAEKGKRIKLEPAVVLDHANAFLKPYGKRLGPDPASGKACMIGGVVANNASGITSGTVLNPYRTVRHLRFILPSGSRIDSSKANADDQLKNSEPMLYQFLENMRDEIRNDDASVKKIRHLFSMKNTVGYGLNAFLDFDKPVEILCRLMIGSEGTLGFISEAEFDTIDDKKYKATALLGFKTLMDAGAAVAPFKEAGMVAVEILSSSALKVVKQLPEMPDIIQQIPVEGAALLIEAHGSDKSELENLIKNAAAVISERSIELHTPFMQTEAERLKLWKARKSLFATVGANRPAGSTVITEDVVVPLSHLVDAIDGVSGLLNRFGFDGDSVIFGHAKDGSLHFNFSVDFNDRARVDAFIHFSDQLAVLICEKLNGALKGEHGTGRAVVSYVRQQWGEKIYQWMKQIKQELDPLNLFNPGVLIDLHSDTYPRNFKTNTIVEPSIDHCVDCGFCESQCPSRFITLTPRQRIIAWREIQRLKSDPRQRSLYRELSGQFAYAGEATCAADGLCQLNCPVDINTGEFIKNLRAKEQKKISSWLAERAASNWSILVSVARILFSMLSIFAKIPGTKMMQTFTRIANRSNRRLFPVWNRYIPRRSMIPEFRDREQSPQYLYFPSCINRMMGPYLSEEDKKKSVLKSLMNISDIAGIKIFIPDGIKDFCCGLPLSSKGYQQAFKIAAQKMTEFIFEQSDQGEIPILVDTSPCTQTLQHYDQILENEFLDKWKKLKFIDIVAFLHDEVMSKNKRQTLPRKVTLHPVCSVKKMGLEEKFWNIAQNCVDNVVQIPVTGCCATAGDRGLHYPELVRSATEIEVSYLKDHPADAYYSSSRTCEIGMSEVSGQSYESIVFLVEEYLKS